MTGALTWARLSFRQQRWELILVAIGVGATALAMLLFASQIEAATVVAAPCLSGLELGPVESSCVATLNGYYGLTGIADNLLLLSFGAPFGIGVLLGAPLVAREIDGGTAQLAWSIGRSRVWWLLRRIAFMTLFVALALIALAVTSELLAAAIAPERTLSEDFTWFGRRGWLLVVRGLGALMLGMLVGAFIGRVLPAVLAAALFMAIAFTGISLAQDRWLESEALVHRMTVSADGELPEYDIGAKYVNTGVETPSGEVLTWQEMTERGMEVTIVDERGRLFASEADMRAGNVLGYDVQFVIPGDRYPAVVAREGALAGALGLAALGATALVVARRRPA